MTELAAPRAQAVVLDADKQAESAGAGQARGLRLPNVDARLDRLRPGPSASVATWGRWTKAAGARAGALVAVFDTDAHAQVRPASADAIDVTDPVGMVVEPESLGWVSGRWTATRRGQAWAEEGRPLPALEPVRRAGGRAWVQGVTPVNQERLEQGQAAVADPRDHFPTWPGGGPGVRQEEGRRRSAWGEADTGQAAWERRRRHGQSANG